MATKKIKAPKAEVKTPNVPAERQVEKPAEVKPIERHPVRDFL